MMTGSYQNPDSTPPDQLDESLIPYMRKSVLNLGKVVALQDPRKRVLYHLLPPEWMMTAVGLWIQKVIQLPTMPYRVNPKRTRPSQSAWR